MGQDCCPAREEGSRQAQLPGARPPSQGNRGLAGRGPLRGVRTETGTEASLLDFLASPLLGDIEDRQVPPALWRV